MTPAEAAALLAVAAAFDNRKPDPDAAQAWALALDGLRFLDCRDVIVAHYRRSNEWIMPAHVISEVRRLRAKRISEAGDPTPPPDLTPEQTIAWLADWRRTVGDGETPAATYPGELKPRHLPDLRELLPSPDAPTTAPHEETSR
jgi:hypothetical protein